jgi:hypothetical protein
MHEIIPIGKKIKHKLEENKRSASWLAEQLNCDRTNIYELYRETTMDTLQLFRISVIAEFNFFDYYSDLFHEYMKKKYAVIDNEQYVQEIEGLRKEKEEFIRQHALMERKLFEKTESYQRIKRMIEQKETNRKCFSPEEQRLLHQDIHHVFTWFIHTLQTACPPLTPDNILYCCLEKLRLPRSIIGLCMGAVDSIAGKARRYRIKKKMGQCKKLFEAIFASCWS